MSTREVEVADTLPPEDLGGSPPPAGGSQRPPPGGSPPAQGGPPIADWDRYELLDLLGKGGMGAVYRARDRRLGRTVAIKFILGADPNLTLRFLREARAQARIDHPNVCRVYEVDHVEGRAYIALQFVDGEPLHKAAARMSLDEKIAVVRDIAIAVQEAHRLGIVHRDLKPGNVLVERTADGRWFPVVMDFGLAREATLEAGITESGMPLGTPAYMSPEQARGDVHAIDRRSDVYSLGATLYELVTGSVPFPATSLVMALTRVIHDDPPAPRTLAPSLPADLETIALKCLAKAPTERYPSARALADDLGRYLDGEPILGRRVPLWHRLRLRARRHRALVILGAWSLAIILAVAALGIRAWVVAAERARLAERLGRDATEIEGSLREAYLWPLHDTRPDRARIRERMRTIEAIQPHLGDLGDAIVHSALGRGHLALHEWREAEDELARADHGSVAPELHAARGRALGELYHRALEETRRSGDKAWLARQQRALEERYLTPALIALQASHGSGETSALLDARIALYRRDFAAAEQRARAIAERAPGSSEARTIAAEAAYGAAITAFDHGDYDVAANNLERATTLYASASEVARSDPSLYDAAAQTWLQRAEIDVRQGHSPREPLERALDVIDHHALRADPDDAVAYTIKAYVLLRWYRTDSLRDIGDRRQLLDDMATAAGRAVEIDPRDTHARASLANAYLYRGRYEAYHDGDGIPWLHRALAEIGVALALQPDDPKANNDRGAMHRWLGTVLDNSGRDPMPEYDAATDSYERASAIDPQYLSACINQTDLQTTIAEHQDAIGQDPRSAVDKARRAGERCLAIDPSYHAGLDLMAQAQLALAHYLSDHHRDPAAALASARAYLDRSETALPGHMESWFHRLVAARIEATALLDAGRDPATALAAGRAALDRVLRQDPRSAFSYVEAARLDLVDAARTGHPATESAALLARAMASADKAIALDHQLADAKLVAAEICLQIATARPSPDVIARGRSLVGEALTQNPRLRGAQRLRDALARLPTP